MKLPSLWHREQEPMRALTRLHNDFERIFDEFTSMEPRMPSSDMSPSCELTEDNSSYIARFDIPGVKKEDVTIEFENNRLTVSAERREEIEGEDRRRRYSEFNYGSVQRSFTLPHAVNDQKIDARFENGVLTVTLPKSETSKTKHIAVQ